MKEEIELIDLNRLKICTYLSKYIVTKLQSVLELEQEFPNDLIPVINLFHNLSNSVKANGRVIICDTLKKDTAK